MGLIPGIPDISPTATAVVPIRPPVEVAASSDPTVSGLVMVMTIVLLFGVILLLIIILILMKIFASPMDAARASRLSGQALILHFETAKSAVFKLANIVGQGLRHKKVEDGTLAAIPDSVNSLGGRPLGVAFSLFGTLLPIKVIAGASVLKERGIKDLRDVYAKCTTKKTEERTDGKGKKVIVESLILNNETLITGYDFTNFDKLLSQISTPKLIPLSVEAAIDYTTNSSNAHYTEARINLKVMKWQLDHPSGGYKILLITAFVALILIVVGAKVI